MSSYVGCPLSKRFEYWLFFFVIEPFSLFLLRLIFFFLCLSSSRGLIWIKVLCLMFISKFLLKHDFISPLFWWVLCAFIYLFYYYYYFFLIWSGRLGIGWIVVVERFISNIKKEVILAEVLMNEMWRRGDYYGF